MHDMSNTRKEIAARLGFAAGNGAKVSFDTYTDMVNELRRFTADSANVQYDWYTAANTWLGRKRTSGNKEIAVEANRAYDAVEREMRPKWRQSRPGAKAEFASPDDISNMAQLLSRVESAVMNKRMDEARKLLKQIAPIVDRNRGDNELDSQGMVRAFNDYKQKLGMSRPGTKAKFAPQIDEAEQELKAWTKKLGYYPDMAKVNIRPNTVMLWFYDQKGKATQLASKLRSVAASMNLSPSAITSEEGRHPAYDGGAARDVGQVTVDYNRSTKASRPGTKTTMTREQTEEQKAGLKIMSAADPAVGAKIAKLIKEGKPQDQAVAIALDMKRRGEL